MRNENTRLETAPTTDYSDRLLGGIDGILVRHSYSQLGVAYNSWPLQIVIANLPLQDDIASRSSPGLVDRGKAEATLNYARPPYPRRQVSGQS